MPTYYNTLDLSPEYSARNVPACYTRPPGFWKMRRGVQCEDCKKKDARIAEELEGQLRAAGVTF